MPIAQFFKKKNAQFKWARYEIVTTIVKQVQVIWFISMQIIKTILFIKWVGLWKIFKIYCNNFVMVTWWYIIERIWRSWWLSREINQHFTLDFIFKIYFFSRECFRRLTVIKKERVNVSVLWDKLGGHR